MNTTVRKILFVCSGNICRSPLAEAILREELARRGTNGRFIVDSAGTHADHTGQQSDPRMRAVARKRGIHVDHRARRVTPEEVGHFDLVFAMDRGHLQTLRRYAGDAGAADHIVMFRSFDPHLTSGRHGSAHAPDVPDPWYGDIRDFEHVHDIVARTCACIAERLAAESDGG